MVRVIVQAYGSLAGCTMRDNLGRCRTGRSWAAPGRSSQTAGSIGAIDRSLSALVLPSARGL